MENVHTTPASPGPTILIVDDDHDIRETLRLVLEETGYPLMEAATAGAGLAYLRRSPTPCVVILDMLLPDMEVSHLLSAVGRGAAMTRHYYVLLTGLAPERLPERAQLLLDKLGCTMMGKPFELDELLEVVHQAVRHLAPATPPPPMDQSSSA